MEKNFSVESLDKGFKSKQFTGLIQRMKNAEAQAIALVKLFSQERYLTIDALLSRLRGQSVPKTDLALVAAYLAGYLSAEAFDSHFDMVIFGSSTMMDAKGETVRASLVALLTMIHEKNVLKLPNRVPRQKRPRKIRAARVPANKKSGSSQTKR